MIVASDILIRLMPLLLLEVPVLWYLAFGDRISIGKII